MVSAQAIEGRWNEVKGRLRKRWGQLSEDELQRFDGNVDQLVGMIQRKTGEARDEIETFLERLTTEGSSAVSQAAESARKYAHQAAERVQETSQQATEAVRQSIYQTEQMVRRHPVESLAVCFGVGLITGVVVGLMLRR